MIYVNLTPKQARGWAHELRSIAGAIETVDKRWFSALQLMLVADLLENAAESDDKEEDDDD